MIYLVSLDGPVLATRASVIPAIARTVQLYFSQLLQLTGRAMLAPEEEVAWAYDHWRNEPVSLATLLIGRYLELLDPQTGAARPVSNTKDALRELRRAVVRRPSLTLEELRALAPPVYEAADGPPAERQHPLLYATGTLDEGHVVARLYQELYLGNSHVRALFGLPQILYRGPGYISVESPTLPSHIVRDALAGARRVVGFSTREEGAVRYNLERFGLLSSFSGLVTREHIAGEERRRERQGVATSSLLPPHPFILEESLATAAPQPEEQITLVTDRPLERAASEGLRGLHLQTSLDSGGSEQS